jgi:hypothetical protein
MRQRRSADEGSIGGISLLTASSGGNDKVAKSGAGAAFRGDTRPSSLPVQSVRGDGRCYIARGEPACVTRGTGDSIR